MKHFIVYLLCLLAFPATIVQAQKGAESDIIQAMNAATESWNRGDLDGYMALYDPAATMMMPQGREGLAAIRALYEKYYFENGQPRQQLRYEKYEFTALGKDYALLTGRFVLLANDKHKERSGTFTVVMVRKGKAWKILHDHSG